LGGNIVEYLIGLKKEHRKKKLTETFKLRIKIFPKGKLKTNLLKFKEGFLGILAHTDHDKEFLRKSVFEFYGDGVGGYSYNNDFELFLKFHKFITSLNNKEKKILLEFLLSIIKENGGLYPTNTVFVCKGHSIDIFPEGL
jgi:hypothetical protein